MTVRPSDGDVLYAGLLCSEFPYTKNLLMMIYNMEVDASNPITLTATDYGNITWDSFINATKYDEVNSSNVCLNTTTHTVMLDISSSASDTYDFTGEAHPAGWTIAESEGGSATSSTTFDAANDEEDFAGSTGTTGFSVTYQTITDNNTYIGCEIKAAFRNITNSITAGNIGINYVGIWKDSSYIRITATDAGNWIITDSKGGSFDTASGSAPNVLWFKLKIRADGYIITQYSLTGDSGYTTLSEAFTGGDITKIGPSVKWYLTNSNQSTNKTGSASCFNFIVYGKYYDNGYFISDAVTSTDTITEGLITSKVTTPTDTTVTYQASADNGVNYENHTRNNFHHFSNTGTQLKVKCILTQTSAADDATPILYYYGYQWK